MPKSSTKQKDRLEPSPENVHSLVEKLTKAHNTWVKNKTYENAVEIQRVKRTRDGMIAELRLMIKRVQ